jgi:hypothetical protein
MQRILLIAAILLPIASAMAAAPHVDIAADVNTSQFNIDSVAHKTVTIKYTVTNGDARAFALDINVDNGMNIGDRALRDFKVGESNSVSKGYGIFPGRFRDFINPSLPNWSDPNYSPDTPWNSPGAENTGRGYPKIVVELGTLYLGEPNKPPTTGTLFTFDVNSEGGNDCNMTVAVNVLRGGIVGSDAAQITDTNLPFTKKVTFAAPCTVPTCVGQTRAACLALLAGTTPPQTAVENNLPGNGEALRQVIAQVPAAGVACTGTVTIDVVSWPILATSPLYVNWQAHNRPQCWAYPRNCKGDIDGLKTGQTWVSATDLNLFKTAFNKAASAMPANGYCGDIDRVVTGQTWVSATDLNLFKTFFNKAESLVPPCGTPPDTNYSYWCAPGGTCPNSP